MWKLRLAYDEFQGEQNCDWMLFDVDKFSVRYLTRYLELKT